MLHYEWQHDIRKMQFVLLISMNETQWNVIFATHFIFKLYWKAALLLAARQYEIFMKIIIRCYRQFFISISYIQICSPTKSPTYYSLCVTIQNGIQKVWTRKKKISLEVYLVDISEKIVDLTHTRPLDFHCVEWAWMENKVDMKCTKWEKRKEDRDAQTWCRLDLANS